MSKMSLNTIPLRSLLRVGSCIRSMNTSIIAARVVMPAAARKAAGMPQALAISRPTAGAQAEPMSWLMPM